MTLGDYILNSDLEGLPSETFGVDDVKVHPKFRFTPQADRFDVAVLLLDRSVEYRFNMKPICLPEKGTDFLGSVGYAAGWGALEPGISIFYQLVRKILCTVNKIYFLFLNVFNLPCFDSRLSDNCRIYWV